jgi:hypothetical protein
VQIVTVTAPSIAAFNAQVAAMQSQVFTNGGWTALGILRQSNGQYTQQFVLAIPSEHYPLIYRGQVRLGFMSEQL